MASELRVDKIMPVDGIGTDTSTAKYGGGIIQVVQNVQGINQVNSPGDSEYDIGLNLSLIHI